MKEHGLSDGSRVDRWQRPLVATEEPLDPATTGLAEASVELEPDAAAPGDTAGPAATEGPVLEALVDRMTGMEAGIAEFHRRSAHREAVIDRLHEENQTLRGGIRRAILEPVVTDLVRLYDAISREARRAEEPGVLVSFTDQVELTLERCGVDIVALEPGDRFRPGTDAATAVVPTSDPTLQDTAVELLAVGLRDQETGRMRRPVRARFHRYIPNDGLETPADRSETDQ